MVHVVGWQSQVAGVTRYAKTLEIVAVTGTLFAISVQKAGLTEILSVHSLQ